MTISKFIYGILLSLALTACMGVNETTPDEYLVPKDGGVTVSGENSLFFTLSSSVREPERVKECGFYCGDTEDLSGAQKLPVSIHSGDFSEKILLKDYESDYYICSYISNGLTEIRSGVEKIEIGPLSDYITFEKPVVDSYVSSTKEAKISVEFSAYEGVDITSAGICYGENRDLSTENSSYVLADNIGQDYISAGIDGMIPGKQYYMRAFVKDGEDIAYAATTPVNVYAVPEVNTLEVKKITDCTAHIYAEVVDDCGKDIEERGFVWMKGDTNPTINSSHKSVPGKTGGFDAEIDGLKPNTLYSVRAYAKNAEGIAYGETIRFTTAVALPAVITERVADVTSLSAMVYARVSDDGGEAVSDFGILLGTSSDIDPDKAQKFRASGSSSSFSVKVTGLTRKTKYYVQAYVTNSVGTSYGKVIEFETYAEIPTVSTISVSNITDVSAVSGGNVTDDGGDEITARGVVWGKTQELSIENDAKSLDGKGAGKYTSSISGLRYTTVYYVRAYATNSVGTAYGEAIKFTTAELDITNVKDLATAGTANCYIVSSSGVYKFPAVKGNGNESVGAVSSAEVLWESFGTSVTPNVGDLIAYASYRDAQIILKTADSFKEGNAVIVAKNSSGDILWSWHIWLTDKPEEQVYYNNAGTMMDRNLGATSATPGDVGALGLLYQWGRKDPFLGSSSISSDIVAKSTVSWPSVVSSSSSKGTVEYAVKNPMTFITCNSSNYDWYYTGSSSTDNTRWESSKTIYDPCPAGWRVPDGGSNGVWSEALGSSSSFDYTYNSTNEGMNFSGKFGSASTIWYPASGNRYFDFGSLSRVGGYGYYWSVAPSSYYAYYLYFDYDGSVNPSSLIPRAYGQSVRCLKISEINGDNEGFGGSDYEW